MFLAQEGEAEVRRSAFARAGKGRGLINRPLVLFSRQAAWSCARLSRTPLRARILASS